MIGEMKKIKITQETEDLREGVEKILPVGLTFRCTDELAKEYLDAGLAEEVDKSQVLEEQPKI